MVVLLNPDCILLSEMLHVHKREVRVAVFSLLRRDDPQNTGFDRSAAIENRRIVWTNTGRFANVSVRQRPVRQRMKSIRQRLMSVRQRLYVSSPTSKITFFVQNNCQLDNLRFTS